MSGAPGGSITVVLTSPRVAPGLLTRVAWTALSSADLIGAGSAVAAGDDGPDAHRIRPDVQAIAGSGFVVTPVDGADAQHWAWLAAAAEAGQRVAWLVGEDGEPGLLRIVAEQLSSEPRPAYEV